MELVWENYAYLIYSDGDVYYLYERKRLTMCGWEQSACFCSDSFDECLSYIIEQECN